MKNLLRKLTKLNACIGAVEFVETQKTPQDAWENCVRGDWMLWYIGKNSKPESNNHRKLVMAACTCARLSLKYLPKDEKRPLKAIQITEKWAKGDIKITIDDVRNAAYAADAACTAADAACAACAACAAANAACAACAAAYAANAANAAAAADAYAYAYAYAACAAALKKCAKIVRKFYPKIGEIR